MAIFRCVLSYCQQMSCLYSRSLDSVKSGLNLIESLAEKNPEKSFIFYGLAKYYIEVKKPIDKILQIIEKGSDETLMSNNEVSYLYSII